jgi:hypothetical protein
VSRWWRRQDTEETLAFVYKLQQEFERERPENMETFVEK